MPDQVEITSLDGVESKVTVFRTHDPQAPVILCKPGMGVWAANYEPLAFALVGRGFNVITADLRGHGESRIRPGRGVDYGYNDMVLYDWPAEVDLAKNLFPASPRVIMGHSLGGQLSTLYMSANPGEIQALILMTCPSLYFRGWPFPRRWNILMLTEFFRMVSAICGYFPGRRLGFGQSQGRRVARDWANTSLTGRYRPVGSAVDYEALLPGLSGPVLSVSFSDDGLYAPESAVLGLCAKLSGATVTHWHLTPDQLGCDSLGHINWIKHSELFMDRVSDWLRSALA